MSFRISIKSVDFDADDIARKCFTLAELTPNYKREKMQHCASLSWSSVIREV